jgi:TRAP-type C4-dicarboxylate transport system substrate-binding protein
MPWSVTVRRLAGTTAAAAAVVAASVAANAQTDMKIGMVTINDPQHESSKWFAAEVEKRTNGRLKPRVFPSAQLGGIQRQVEGLQLGTQEAFVTPPAFFVGFAPAFQAADGPGLFDTLEHQTRVLNDPKVRDKWLTVADGAGIIGIWSWGAGEPAIASTQPIRKIADFKGQKPRVLATKIETGLVGEFGATGVPIDYSEALAAIQNKVIDGARSAITVMGPSKFYTVAKYITLTADIYIPSGLWVNKAWFNKLPGDVQKVVTETGREVLPVAIKSSHEVSTHWQQEWAKNGGEVIRFAPAERQEYMRRARPLGEKLLGGHDNPRVREMYQLLRATADATRGS